MLVLVSFGLVLLATILLVVGLLSDDGINLIYLSIAASATAAVVLFLAFRMARPKGEPSADAPAPLADDIAPTAVSEAPAQATVAPAPAPAAAPPAPPPVSTTPEPVPAPTEDDWADDADWVVDDEVIDFPIADYDDLTVAEIMPLLPQLYSDELDIVYEREQNGKNRSSILGELDKLRQTGTEADALEQAESPAPAPAPATSPEPAPAAAAEPTRTSLLGDDFDDEGAFFPIADYDDLSVSQIVPLLPQLELDELRDVRDREVAGANRTTLVSEIDRYLSGELQAYVFEDDEFIDEAPAPVDPEVERLPIRNYLQLDVSEVLAELDDLTPAQIEQIVEFEAARDNRYGIVEEGKRRLEAAAPATPTRPRKATKKTKASARRKASPTKKRAATKKKSAAKKSTKKSAKKSTKKSAKRATKTTKKRAARFPIANYDELNVADIRPRLTDLSDSQLRQVRDREETGAGRKTILDDIERRLS